ncbi:MAG: TonB-dependent receptor [Erythrobacter sp.]|jgi:outer membrane receptor protein involved in Fe transport
MKLTISTLGGRAALFTGVGIAALAIAEPAMAQEAADDATAEEDSVPSQAIVVTGSRIARPNLDAQTPVTVLSGEQIFKQGNINVGDALNELPQLRSTFGQTNAGRFLGTTGLNLLDLRGLGTQRTLTLVNGRRHVPSDILNNGVSTDVNTIPNDLIQRIEVVTGGNSAIYGSDAIAGVVNFILKDDFEGLQLRGHANVNDDGQFGGQYVSALAGTNFADERGNVLIHAEYASQDRVYGSELDWLRRQNGFLTIDVDPAGLTNGSDGFPDRAFFTDIRSASIHYDGLVPIAQPTATARCGIGIGSTNGAPTNTGTPYNCTYIFAPDGQLVPQTGTRVGTGPIGSIVGGNGQTGRELQLLTVLPRQERFNVNLLAHFEISPALVPFIEAKFVKIQTQGQQSTPAFIQGGTLGDSRERPRLDNPYLDPAARTLIANELLASGLRSSSLTNRAALTAGDIAAIAAGTYRFTVARFLQDLGTRDEKSDRDVYRIVGGLRGKFNNDWSYELSLNYGEVREDTTILGNIIPQRFLLAIDSVRDPATGNIVCRSQIDPTAAFAYDSEADLAAEIANCVPYNPFGAPDNSAARDYITQDTVSNAKLSQFVASAFLSGDTSGFFNLPGGPLGFAVGAEYRREKLFYRADPIVEAGRTFYNALPTFAPEAFEVKEAFGELRVPLLRDIPLIDELTLSGSARISDYDGSVGTTWAYNGGFEWQIIPDIRIRGQYGRSVRAPNLTETSFPLTQNFAPGFSDPCLPQNIGNNANRAVNCAADLGTLLNDPGFQALPAYSLEILSGSNPNLTEEKSDSYTLGAVFTPRFIPGLSLTVDYFDVRVNDVITSVSAQQLVNTCYDLPTLDNPFCALINRFRGPGTGPNDEIPGQILERNLVVSGVNFAARTVRGYDVDVGYNRDLGNDFQLNSRLIYTHLFERSNFENPTTPDFENRILNELGDPQDEFRWTVDLKKGPISLGYTMQYIGPQVLNLYEDTNPLQDRTPQNEDYADTINYQAVFYHDVRFGLELDNGFEFSAGVDNLLNTNPPLGLTGIGGGSAIYRVRGRNLYAGVKAKF